MKRCRGEGLVYSYRLCKVHFQMLKDELIGCGKSFGSGGWGVGIKLWDHSARSSCQIPNPLHRPHPVPIPSRLPLLLPSF